MQEEVENKSVAISIKATKLTANVLKAALLKALEEICVGIYAVLVNALSLGGDLQASIWSCAAYTVLLCFSLFKTGSVAKSILNAH